MFYDYHMHFFASWLIQSLYALLYLKDSQKSWHNISWTSDGRVFRWNNFSEYW